METHNKLSDDQKKLESNNEQELELVEEKENERKRGFKSFIKDAASGVANKAKETYNQIKENIEDSRLEQQNNKRFQQEYNDKTYLFEVTSTQDKNGRPLLIRAFRIDKETLYIPSREDNRSNLFSGTKLLNTQDKSKIKIKYLEIKEVVIYTLKVDDTEHPIQCFKAIYSYDEDNNDSKITNITNTVNQNVSIAGSNTGDISLVSNIEIELEEFMQEIRDVKTSRIGKVAKAKTEAIKIIGPVKDTIINGKKDKELIDKFIELLGVFASGFITRFVSFLSPQ